VAKYIAAFSTWYWEGVDAQRVTTNGQTSAVMRRGDTLLGMVTINASEAGIDARTYILTPASVTVSMKSAASSASACERRKSVQVVAALFGAGSIPASRRICQTVEAATLIPRVSSSPCTRR